MNLKPVFHVKFSNSSRGLYINHAWDLGKKIRNLRERKLKFTRSKRFLPRNNYPLSKLLLEAVQMHFQFKETTYKAMQMN